MVRVVINLCNKVGSGRGGSLCCPETRQVEDDLHGDAVCSSLSGKPEARDTGSGQGTGKV